MNATTTPRGASPHFISTFRPSRWRYMSYKVLVMFAAYQLGYVLLNLFFPEQVSSFAIPPSMWLTYSLIFMAVYALSLAITSRSLVDDLCIRISGESIEGPSGDTRGRVHFLIDQLDKEKTRRTNWQNRLFQYRHIWSLDGKRIVLITHAFDQLQLNNLLEKLGCREKDLG